MLFDILSKLKGGKEKMKKSYVLIDAVMGSVWEDEMMAESMPDAIEEAKYQWLHMFTPQERENREEFAVCKMRKFDDGCWDYDSMTNYHDIIKMCGR